MTKMNDKTEIFENYSIPKAVATLALPTMLSMIVVVIYNMVDTFFVAKIGDPNQIAAVSLTHPAFMLFMAAGNIFGIGGSSYLSRSLGEKKIDRVKHISSFCVWSAVVVGVLMGILYLVFLNPILKLCGASAATLPYARTYLSIVAWGAPATVLSFVFGNICRAEGAAKESMFGQMLGSVINIILDPIFILIFGWGVAGAAIATVIANILSDVYYIVYIVHSHRSQLTLNPKKYAINDGILGNVLAIGLPASFTNLLMSASQMVSNNYLASYGDIPVAAMGIAGKAGMFVILGMIGLAGGVVSLIGYNYGAKNFDRMRAVTRFAMFCNVCIGTAFGLVFFIAAKFIVGIFINDPEVIAHGVPMLRAMMLSAPFVGCLFVINNCFQAWGKASPALILSVCRQGLVFLPVVIAANAMFGLNGIIYAQPIADVVSVVMAFIMYFVLRNKVIAGSAS